MKKTIGLILLLGVYGCSPNRETQGAIDNDGGQQAETLHTEPQLQESTPEKTLDLSRQHLQRVVDESAHLGEAVGEDQAALPDLFDGDDPDKRVKVGGSIITNEDALSMKDKVDGVQFKLEVSTP